MKLLEIILGKIKNLKTLAWITAILAMLLIVLYPIVDANFLYYNRTINRIEILERLAEVKRKDLGENEILTKEYDAILSEVESSRSSYVNQIIFKEESPTNNLIKGIFASWLLALAGVLIIFGVGQKTRKIRNNFPAALLCIIIGVAAWYLGVCFPTIISVWVNVILYQAIAVFFGSMLIKYSKRKTENSHKSLDN